jgi:hypothetical protein
MADKYVKLDDIIETLEHEWGYEGMREDLYNLPTADVVEVVRCKDCQYFDGEGCLKTHGEFEPNLTDYCSYGERRCDE